MEFLGSFFFVKSVTEIDFLNLDLSPIFTIGIKFDLAKF